MTIIQAIEQFFSSWFSAPSWAAWLTFLKVLFALPLDDQDLLTYQQHTQRTAPPAEPFREAWLVVGRRGGKSLIAALVAVFLACFRDYSDYLAAGEVGTVAVIAADRKQARTILRYIRGFLALPVLRSLVTDDTRESIELRVHDCDIAIEVHTASWRSVRGYTLLACIADEIAFWRSEDSANPDSEIIAAVRPGLATIPSSLLLCISSPYARRGALWETYSRHFGTDSQILVWQAASREMNPSLPQSIIDQALADDESAARAEFFAEFRSDLESYIDRGLAQSLVVPGRYELPWVRGVHYIGFTDPAGGSGKDSYTMGIAHHEGTRFLVDVVREVRPPFSPEQVTRDFAEVFRAYGVRKIRGDRYAGEWPREQFRKNGVEYEPSEKSKSELYKDALPLLNSRLVELLDNPRLVAQLCGLERRTSRAGNDSIDHAPNGHDDVINAVCGAITQAAKRKKIARVDGGSDDPMLSAWQELSDRNVTIYRHRILT